MRASGRSIRIRKSPAFSGRSIYLDGVSDFIDFQSVGDLDITGNDNNTSYYVGRRNAAMSYPVSIYNGSGHWGRYRTERNNPLNYVTGLNRENITFRPASWQFWVKFPQSEIDDVKTRYANGGDLTKVILHECNGAAFNQQGTNPNIGHKIGLQSNTSGSVGLTMGFGRAGVAISKRVFRQGHSMLAPNEWYHVVCVYDGWKEVGDPGFSMWVNGKTRANVTLKLKDHSSSNKASIVRIEDAEGVVKYYWLNARSNLTYATGYGVNIQQYADGIPNGSNTFLATQTVNMEGLSAAESAAQLKIAIEGSGGHNGSIICNTDGTGYITLQQKTPGTSGNIDIKLTRDDGGDNLGELDNIFELNGQILQVAGHGNKYYSASFSNGTDKQVTQQIATPSYPNGQTSGELPYAVPAGNHLIKKYLRTGMTTFIGKDNTPQPSTIHTAMHISECAFWENTALDNDDVTGLYNNGSILSDLTTDSSGYTKSQPKTASLVIPMHNIQDSDCFRLENTVGKYRWFVFKNVEAATDGISNIAKRGKTTIEDRSTGWDSEFNKIKAEYRIVFGQGARYGGVTLSITTTDGTQKIYTGANTGTINGSVTELNAPRFVSNVILPSTKAHNLAAAISSSEGHGTGRISSSIGTTVLDSDTLILRTTNGITIGDFDSGDYPVVFSAGAGGFAHLTQSLHALSSSFVNGGSDHRLIIPTEESSNPAELAFSHYTRPESTLLKIARFVTASITHRDAFGASMSCSIVYANASNHVVASGSDTRPAVRIHQTVAGGIGNTPVVYGGSKVLEFNHNWGTRYYGTVPVAGLSPYQHKDIHGNGYTGSFTSRYLHKNNDESRGLNYEWSHLGARSESFSGGGLQLLGWWKMSGPAAAPTEPRINVLLNSIQSSSMMEYPEHLHYHTHLGKKNNTYRTRDRHHMRTNNALNMGGTWSGESPS